MTIDIWLFVMLGFSEELDSMVSVPHFMHDVHDKCSFFQNRSFNLFVHYFLAHSTNGIWVTTAGDLTARYLIHLDSQLPGKSSKKWTSAIMECLSECDRRQATSIAFPALGTGMVPFSRMSFFYTPLKKLI